MSARGPRRDDVSSLDDSPQRLKDVSHSPRQATTKAEFEARQKAKVHAARHQQIQQDRSLVEQQIQERKAKLVEARDKRCEALLESIGRSSDARVKASQHINDHDALYRRKMTEVYDKYDAEVAQRVEGQLLKFMHTAPPPLPGGREALHKSDDPMKAEVRAQQAEEKFHRAARSILSGSAGAEDIKRRRELEQLIEGRTTSRQIFPVDKWEQQQHYATPYGYFEQACLVQAEGGGLRSARRMGVGAHGVDESDGVSAAGKTKTRFERNQIGMLAGTLAKEGEAAKFKTMHGAGSGAPCQDHYHYEKGNAVADAEFPVGKKMFSDLRNY